MNNLLQTLRNDVLRARETVHRLNAQMLNERAGTDTDPLVREIHLAESRLELAKAEHASRKMATFSRDPHRDPLSWCPRCVRAYLEGLLIALFLDAYDRNVGGLKSSLESFPCDPHRGSRCH